MKNAKLPRHTTNLLFIGCLAKNLTYTLALSYGGRSNSDEIISKTRSLKGVLEPFSTQGNLDLLKRAGFVDIQIIMNYICFQGFLAIK